jgi:hypothetical protein
MKTITVYGVLVAVAALVLAVGPLPARSSTMVMEFNDGPESSTQIKWSEYAYNFWEEMFQNAADQPACSICDLDPSQDYYAYSPIMTNTYTDCAFWAEIYFANNWLGSQNVIYVTLGVGLPGNAASFVPFTAPVSQVVTNQMEPPYCGMLYVFNFGMIPEVLLNQESLIVRIHYTGAYGDGHIYWDSECCPSALYIDCPSPVESGTWSTIKAMYR